MSKVEFMDVENEYIQSVATTAGTATSNVKVLSVEEISSRILANRVLLGTSVSVETSVILSQSQLINIRNQSILNANLAKNGLPSGILVVQNSTSDTPVTQSASGPESENVIGAVVGGVVGFLALLCAIFVAYKLLNPEESSQMSSANSAAASATFVTQVPLEIDLNDIFLKEHADVHKQGHLKREDTRETKEAELITTWLSL